MSAVNSNDFVRREQFARLAPYRTSHLGRAIGQLASTFLPYIGVVALMYATLGASVWLTAALAVLAAGLVVRIFIIQHDCGHGSFFASRHANQVLGRLCGVITLTPFASWRRQHARHHAVWNNLDRRSVGVDIYSSCLTVREYLALSPVRRWLYRLGRHPLVAQLLLPPLVFLVVYRFPFDTPSNWRRERLSVYATNAAIAAAICVLVLTLGAWPVIAVQLPIIAIAAIAGVWLFSAQHRFENALWMNQNAWDPLSASLLGSSYLKLPRVLQWFTGNIGFHHLHHLSPRIPNYQLPVCHDACQDLFGFVATLSLREGLVAPMYVLWDEEAQRMLRLCEL